MNYKKIIALLLCAAMLLSLAACGGEPEPTPSAEPAPDPGPDPVELALENYDKALAELLSRDSLRVKATAVLSRNYGGQVFTETISDEISYHGLQSGSPSVYQLREAAYPGYEAMGYECEYEYLLLDDRLYIDGLWLADAEAAEAYRASLYPLELLSRENYEEISQEGGYSLSFSGATAPESWLGIDPEDFISGSGEAEIDSAGLDSLSYTASYTRGAVTVEMELTLRFYEDADELPEAPEEEGLTPLADHRIPELFDRAFFAAGGGSMQSVSGATLTVVEAGALAIYENMQMYLAGRGDSLRFESSSSRNIQEGYNSTQQNIEEKLYDGLYTIDVDGEVSEQALSGEDLDMSYVLTENLFTPYGALSLSMEEIDGYYFIEFELGEEEGLYMENYLCSYYYNDPYILDDLASDYRTEKCGGWLSIDADSLLPVSWGYEFRGVHTLEGQELAISLDDYMNFDMRADTAAEELGLSLDWETEPEEKASPLFYKVTSPEGKSMWLLGTIHVGDVRTDYLPDSVMNAFYGSDVLAVEMNTDDFEERLEADSALMDAYTKAYFYEDGSVLKDHIGEELYERLLKTLKYTGNFMGANTEYLRPDAHMSGLDFAYLEHATHLSSQHGVDNMLQNRAKELGIEIWEVEDVGEHLSIMTDTSIELQKLLLEESLNTSRYEYAPDVTELFELWCRGDEEEILKYFLEESEYEEDVTQEELALYEEYNNVMLTVRNEIMHNKAVEYLSGDKTVFYAVGLAHVVGEGSLVESLREAGYTVELVE